MMLNWFSELIETTGCPQKKIFYLLPYAYSGKRSFFVDTLYFCLIVQTCERDGEQVTSGDGQSDGQGSRALTNERRLLMS